ncbi:hypothetical protein LJR289_002197 [Pseudoduganella sp. LjRoot289]|uniref:hypothetical protein n=1 Tax=Pseudoduganella sp. LjRoot289 TaxID=3342314 RepID=UPI003ED03855
MTIFNADSTFVWRLMRAEEAPLVHQLHCAVLALVPQGMVRPDDLGHFQSHAERQGRVLCCHADGELVAYGVLAMESHTVDHMAELLQAGPADRARMCVLDGAASLPEWRGRRLHCAGIEERIALGQSLGRTLVSATVAPENMRSLRGLLLEGFSVRRYAIVYGGLARLVMLRDLAQPPVRWNKQHEVASNDHISHRMALSEGLVGYECWQDQDQRWYVNYGTAARA